MVNLSNKWEPSGNQVGTAEPIEKCAYILYGSHFPTVPTYIYYIWKNYKNQKKYFLNIGGMFSGKWEPGTENGYNQVNARLSWVPTGQKKWEPKVGTEAERTKKMDKKTYLVRVDVLSGEGDWRLFYFDNRAAAMQAYYTLAEASGEEYAEVYSCHKIDTEADQ